MATVYISPTGGAVTQDGLTPDTAYAFSSLSTAETQAQTGGTIIFLNGNYTFGGGNKTFAGANNLTYESQNINGAVLGDIGANRLLTIGSGSVGGLTLKNFKLVDLYFYAGTSLPVNCTVENCYLAATVAEDYTSTTPKIKAQGTATGVYLIFKNCVIEYNCNTTADRLIQGDDLKLQGCTNHITTGSATSIGFAFGPPAEMKNCIWFSDDDTAIGTATSGNTSRGDFAANSSFSSFYQMGSTNDSGGTDNLYDTDPLFVDSANGDYRLRPSSPCINAGTAS